MSTINLLRNHRELLWAWTLRTILARYQQSVLGVLWSVAQPIAQVAILSVIFVYVVPIDTGDIPYPVFNFTAVAPWLLFQAGITDMVVSLVANMNLVTKIYFPREILPIAALLARLLDFVISLGVLVVLMFIFDMPFQPLGWLFLPVVIGVQMMLAVGLGLFGAALNVFYRDVHHVFILVLRVWYFASPIIYPVTRVPERFHPLYFLNPMAGILEAYRSILLNGELPDYSLGLAAAVSFVVFILGYWFFKRMEFRFADVV